MKVEKDNVITDHKPVADHGFLLYEVIKYYSKTYLVLFYIKRGNQRDGKEMLLREAFKLKNVPKSGKSPKGMRG